MRKMSNKITGEILLPCPELFEWTIGSYLDILKNKKIGEITTHLKFPVILVDLEVEAAIQNGCEYVKDHNMGTSVTGDYWYTGFIKNGMPHGPGIKLMSNGSVQDGNYEGMFANGLCLYIFPKGADDTDVGRYEGEFLEGKRHGFGVDILPNGTRYVGQFRDNKREGQGTQTTDYDTSHSGAWKGGLKHGPGVYHRLGEILRGSWVDDLMEGEFMVTPKEGDDERQVYKNNKIIGYYNADGSYVEIDIE